MKCLTCDIFEVKRFKTATENREFKKEILVNNNFKFIENRFLSDSSDGQEECFLDIFQCKICNTKWYLPEPQDVWAGCFRKQTNWFLYWYGLKIGILILIILYFTLLGGYSLIIDLYYFISNWVNKV